MFCEFIVVLEETRVWDGVGIGLPARRVVHSVRG